MEEEEPAHRAGETGNGKADRHRREEQRLAGKVGALDQPRERHAEGERHYHCGRGEAERVQQHAIGEGIEEGRRIMGDRVVLFAVRRGIAKAEPDDGDREDGENDRARREHHREKKGRARDRRRAAASARKPAASGRGMPSGRRMPMPRDIRLPPRPGRMRGTRSLLLRDDVDGFALRRDDLRMLRPPIERVYSRNFAPFASYCAITWRMPESGKVCRS